MSHYTSSCFSKCTSISFLWCLFNITSSELFNGQTYGLNKANTSTRAYTCQTNFWPKFSKLSAVHISNPWAWNLVKVKLKQLPGCSGESCGLAGYAQNSHSPLCCSPLSALCFPPTTKGLSFFYVLRYIHFCAIQFWVIFLCFGWYIAHSWCLPM